MSGYIEQIETAATELAQCAESLDQVQTVAGELEQARAISRRYRPSIMFYGTYNSGKSTLLNALKGERIAPTADAPCTSTIDEYSFGDYIVFDTPGIDAPEDHERVSKEHLRQVDVVLFVVSASGLVDEEKTVNELADLLRAGPVVLVLNDKEGRAVASPKLVRQASIVQAHLRSIAGDEAMSRLQLVLVNAELGLRGRLEGKPQFVEHSGVEELRRVIEAGMDASAGPRLMIPAVGILEDVASQLLQRARTRLDQPGTVLVDALMQELIAVRDDLQAQLFGHVDSMRSRGIRTFETSLADGKSPAEVAGQFLREAQEQAALKLQRAEARLEAAGKRVEARFTGVELAGSPASPLSNTGAAPDAPFPLNPKKIAGWAAGKEGIEAIHEGLRILRSLKVRGIKGRWDRTLGKWAGKIGRGVGVAIQVATVLWEVKQALDAQEAVETRARNRRQQLATAAQSSWADFEGQLRREIRNFVHETFEPMRQALVERRRASTEDEGHVTEVITRLEGIRRRLANLQDAVKGN